MDFQRCPPPTHRSGRDPPHLASNIDPQAALRSLRSSHSTAERGAPHLTL